MEWVIFSREPRLTSRQFGRLANIFDNAGQVVLGIAVLSPLIGFDRMNIFVVLSGLGAVIICWSSSMYFERRGNNDI